MNFKCIISNIAPSCVQEIIDMIADQQAVFLKQVWQNQKRI